VKPSEVLVLAVLVVCQAAVAQETADGGSGHEAAEQPTRQAGGGEQAPGKKPRHRDRPKKKPPEQSPVEVVITAPRPLSRDNTGDEVLVEGQQLARSPQDSMLEALAREDANVYVPARGVLHGIASGATGSIHMRGLGGSPNTQVLVVEDGVPDYQGIFGHPIPDAYLPFLVDRVLLVKGGDSVLYGNNAMGGAVVIRSRWLESPGCQLLADSSWGSYFTQRQVAGLLANLGSWDLAAAFVAMSSDGHRDGAGGRQLVGISAARYRFANGLRLVLRNKFVHLKGADPGPASHPFADHWFAVWRDNAALQLSWRPAGVRLETRLYANSGVHRLYDGFYSVDYVAGGALEATLYLHPGYRLLLGLAAETAGGRVEDRSSGERPTVRSLSDTSCYQQFQLRPVEELELVVGARALLQASYGTALLYKGGLRWLLGGGFALRTRLARNFRHPTIRELYLPFPTANPGLRPEHSLNWDLGASYQSRHLEIRCTVYRTAADDLIKYFGSWPTAEVVNIDHIVIWGVEARVALRKLGPFSFFLAGNWQDVGRYTRQNPSAKMNFGLQARWPLGRQAIAARLEGQWVHGLYMADYGRRPLDDVFVVDASLRYRYRLPGRGLVLEPYLLLRNLLDNRYAYIEDYLMPGLNFSAGLRLEM